MAIQITKILLKFKVTWRVIPNGVANSTFKDRFLTNLEIKTDCVRIMLEILLNRFFLLQLIFYLNPLSASFTKWSNTHKQFVANLPSNCLSVFGRFVGLALTGLRIEKRNIM